MAVLWHHGVNTGRLTPNEFVARHLDQRRADLQHLSAQGRGQPRGRRRPRGLGPGRRADALEGTHHSKLDFNILEGYA